MEFTTNSIHVPVTLISRTFISQRGQAVDMLQAQRTGRYVIQGYFSQYNHGNDESLQLENDSERSSSTLVVIYSVVKPMYPVDCCQFFLHFFFSSENSLGKF